eukprot:scaffold28014_cov33-Tisochrysis_lutea.AAC.3
MVNAGTYYISVGASRRAHNTGATPRVDHIISLTLIRAPSSPSLAGRIVQHRKVTVSDAVRRALTSRPASASKRIWSPLSCAASHVYARAGAHATTPMMIGNAANSSASVCSCTPTIQHRAKCTA